MTLKYKRVVIYYFSGTGNARNCADWICATARSMGIDARMVDITKIGFEDIGSPAQGTLVGFCSPTHGLNFPAVMRGFIRRFPLSCGAHAFVLNTRAGVRIFNGVLPGLSGVLHYISAGILMSKGYVMAGAIPVDLPSNWISIHPAIGPRGTGFIYDKQKRKVTEYAVKILSGGRVYRAFCDIVQDLIVAPGALAYALVGRFIFAKSFVASRECDRCMICLKGCPVGAISIVDGRMFWGMTCESCMRCINACPRKAIETAHGFIVAFMYLFSALSSAALTFISSHAGVSDVFPWINKGPVRFGLSSIAMLLFFVACYRLLHLLMRFAPVERVVTCSSLTHLRCWGRYRTPAPVEKNRISGAGIIRSPENRQPEPASIMRW